MCYFGKHVVLSSSLCFWNIQFLGPHRSCLFIMNIEVYCFNADKKKKDTNVNLQKCKEKSYQVKRQPNILSVLVLNSEWKDWSTFFSFLNYLRAQLCLRAQPLIIQVKDLGRMWDKSGWGMRLGKEGTEFFGSHCIEFKWEWKK
jgi:hypothetical protein